MKIAYANIPESIYDLRFLKALREEYDDIYLVHFEKQNVELFACKESTVATRSL
jgi:hypothetical protein